MRKVVALGLLSVLFMSCSKDDERAQVKNENSSVVNLSIGIQKDADLVLVLNTLNDLKFDIRQMNGFVYSSNSTEMSASTLIEILNQKTYINVADWGASPTNVYFDPLKNNIQILNTFFNMNLENQQDLLNSIAMLDLKDCLSETKNIYLSVPIGSEAYWKTQMLTYPFVKWAEPFNDFCISYKHADILFAEVPDSGTVNQTIPIPIIFEIVNGCGMFGNIVETNSGATKTIKLNSKYEGCVCTEIMGEVQTTYNFVATTAGTHTINFLQPTGEFLTYTINIQ